MVIRPKYAAVGCAKKGGNRRALEDRSSCVNSVGVLARWISASGSNDKAVRTWEM